VYAPLVLGVATVVFEGTPAYPDFSRYWEVCAKHSVTQFYVAPTALRLLKRAGDEHVKHDMKHLRVLGSVGEPIAAEVWKWYHEIIGKQNAHVVDVSSFSKLRLRSADTNKLSDLLANRNRLPRHHTPRRNHPYQAWFRLPSLLRHRARDH
jgi:acetyl-CoA synthetase